MQVEISAPEVHVSERLRDHIERRIHFALKRLAQHIRKVRVQMRDLNGPRGGVDKSCRLTIALASGPPLVIEDRASNTHAAIDCVADKAATSIVRRVERKHGRIRVHTAAEHNAGETRVFAVAPEKAQGSL